MEVPRQLACVLAGDPAPLGEIDGQKDFRKVKNALA